MKMSDSGTMNECCGHSVGHARNCPAGESDPVSLMLRRARQIVFDDGTLVKKHTDGKWYGESGEGLTKMRYDSPAAAYEAMRKKRTAV